MFGDFLLLNLLNIFLNYFVVMNFKNTVSAYILV